MASFVIIKDAIGWRLAPYTDYDGQIFHLENGGAIGKHEGFIAEPENLLAIGTGGHMKTPDELTIPDLDAHEIMPFLKKMGMCLDHEWRIRKFMKAPYTNIKAGHVAPMIELHIQFCSSVKKDPESMPLHLAAFEDKIGLLLGNTAGLIPEVPGGEIYLYKDRMGHEQIVLKHKDYYAYPKGQRDDAPIVTLMLIKFMDRTEPSGFESVEELLGKDKFVTPEGMIVGHGSYMTISIDDILNPPSDGEKKS